MKLFQVPYNWIKNWIAPFWLKKLLQSFNDIMIAIAKQAGQAYIDYLKAKIIEVAQHGDWSNDEKFDYVFSQAKLGFTDFAIKLKDSEVSALIEFLIVQLKKISVIA